MSIFIFEGGDGFEEIDKSKQLFPADACHNEKHFLNAFLEKLNSGKKYSESNVFGRYLLETCVKENKVICPRIEGRIVEIDGLGMD